MKQSEILADLIDKTNYCIKSAENFLQMNDKSLNKNPTATSWNVLQCIQHLNLYGDFYLPEFKERMNKAKPFEADREFKPGFWGKLFTNMMLPEEGKKTKTMKSFKSKNPAATDVSRKDLNVFLNQQYELLKLLQKAQLVNINKNNCKLTLPLLKMNLGATLQFVIFHHIRHIEQAKRAVSA